MLVEADGLRKIRRKRTAINTVDFRADIDEAVGLVGPVGAGKTTLLQILAGRLEPDHGNVRVFGLDPLAERKRASARIGWVQAGAPIYPELSPLEFLTHFAALHALPSDAARNRVRRLLQDCGLGEAMDIALGDLAAGYRWRAALAAALVHDPLLVLVDEPGRDMDPVQCAAMQDALRAIMPDRCLILASSRPADIAPVCTRLVAMAQGRIVDDRPTADFTGVPGGVEAALRALFAREELLA